MSCLPLMIWLSPAFPVGAFAYSHGLEWAHEAGDVTDAASLEGWLSDLLAYGAARNDAILFAESYRAALAGDAEALAESAELALALANSAERRLETTTQGDAFMAAAAKAWPCAALDRLRSVWSDAVAYPVAVGVAAAGHGMALGRDALRLFFSPSSRTSSRPPCGSASSARPTASASSRRSLPHCPGRLPRSPTTAALDDLGGCAFRSDLASLRHETQYTRLFRS